MSSTELLKVIDDFGNFSQLAEIWEELGAKHDSPIQDFNWAQACAESICANDSPRIMISNLGKQSVAIAPMIKQKGIFSPLQMLGVAKIYEPMDMLYTDMPALNSLLEELRKLGVAIVLDRIPADSPTIPAIQRVYQGYAWVVTRSGGSCPYIALNQDWTEPEKQFNSGRRSDFRRAQRKIASMGEVTYEIVSPTPETVEPLLNEAFLVEAQSWKGEKGSALAIDNTRGDFYRRYAIAANQAEILRLCFLRMNGQAVAMQIAIEYASRFWLLKIGYNANFSQCSPGNLLMLHVIKYAATKNLRSFEFLGNTAPWTKIWTELERPCAQVRVYPYNLNGSLSLASDAVKVAWKQLKTERQTSRI